MLISLPDVQSLPIEKRSIGFPSWMSPVRPGFPLPLGVDQQGGASSSLGGSGAEVASCDMLPLSMKARGLLAASLFLLAATSGASNAPLVVLARIDTPIHPASANYLEGVLAAAEEKGRGARGPDALDSGRAPDLDARDELRDPSLRVPVATFVAPVGRPGGVGRLSPPAIGRRRGDGAGHQHGCGASRWAERARTFRRR